jgi:hypothetical protein
MKLAAHVQTYGMRAPIVIFQHCGYDEMITGQMNDPDDVRIHECWQNIYNPHYFEHIIGRYNVIAVVTGHTHNGGQATNFGAVRQLCNYNDGNMVPIQLSSNNAQFLAMRLKLNENTGAGSLEFKTIKLGLKAASPTETSTWHRTFSTKNVFTLQENTKYAFQNELGMLGIGWQNHGCGLQLMGGWNTPGDQIAECQFYLEFNLNNPAQVAVYQIRDNQKKYINFWNNRCLVSYFDQKDAYYFDYELSTDAKSGSDLILFKTATHYWCIFVVWDSPILTLCPNSEPSMRKYDFKVTLIELEAAVCQRTGAPPVVVALNPEHQLANPPVLDSDDSLPVWNWTAFLVAGLVASVVFGTGVYWYRQRKSASYEPIPDGESI